MTLMTCWNFCATRAHKAPAYCRFVACQIKPRFYTCTSESTQATASVPRIRTEICFHAQPVHHVHSCQVFHLREKQSCRLPAVGEHSSRSRPPLYLLLGQARMRWNYQTQSAIFANTALSILCSSPTQPHRLGGTLTVAKSLPVHIVLFNREKSSSVSFPPQICAPRASSVSAYVFC